MTREYTYNCTNCVQDVVPSVCLRTGDKDKVDTTLSVEQDSQIQGSDMDSLLYVMMAVCCAILAREVRARGTLDCYQHCHAHCCVPHDPQKHTPRPGNEIHCPDCFKYCCTDHVHNTAIPTTSSAAPPTYSDWGECTVTCGGGHKYRHCVGNCPLGHMPEESRRCNEHTCPVTAAASTGTWTDWGAWSQCSATCGDGDTYRSRACYQGNRHVSNRYCHGHSSDKGHCTNGNCQAVESGWGAWQSWSDCSSTCGAGTRVRHRLCNNPHTHHSHHCHGSSSEKQHCNHTNACTAVDGGWGSWSAWSGCRGSCGQGKRERHRLCNNPRPQYGGICHGLQKDKLHCNDTSTCPVYHNCTKLSVLHALAEINSTSITTCHDNWTAHTEEFLMDHCKAPNDTSQWHKGQKVTHYCGGSSHDHVHPYLPVGTFKHNQYGEEVTSGFSGVLVACNANNTGFKIASRICRGVAEVIELPLPANFHHTSTGVIPDSPEEYYLIKWD